MTMHHPSSLRMAALVSGLVLILCAAGPAGAERVGLNVGPSGLVKDQWVWASEESPAGPIVVVVSLNEQLAFVYRNGIRIGYSNVSTGKKGYETPTGVFTVLEKSVHHVSSIYHAKMPYTERLTWGGISLHSGGLPGYPSSHGCVHLPLDFSRLLFEADSMGTTVVIANDHEGPSEASHPGFILSPSALEDDDQTKPVLGNDAYSWQPDRAPDGPLSLLVSAADQKLYVYRAGIEIGVAHIHVADPESPVDEGVFSVLIGKADHDDPWLPGQPAHRWLNIHGGDAPGAETEEQAVNRIHIPRYFSAVIYEMIKPGTTLVITNLAAAPHTKSESGFVVVAAQEAQANGS